MSDTPKLNLTSAEAIWLTDVLKQEGYTVRVIRDDISLVYHGREPSQDELDGVHAAITKALTQLQLNRTRPPAPPPFEPGNIEYRPKPAPQPITGYRELDKGDIALMNEMKAAMNAYGAILDRLRNDTRIDQRWLAIARTDAQTSCMAACRAVAQPGGFA